MGRKTPRRNGHLRTLFANASGKCYYCQRQCLLICDQRPKDRATIDHIYPKDDIRRKIVGNDKKYTVLACDECNGKRNQEFQRTYITPNSTLWHPWLIGILNEKP